MKIQLLGMALPLAMTGVTLFGNGSWEADLSQDTGEVLNIWCWNREFLDCMIENYPEYKDNGDGTGSIGDVKVNWIIEESYDMNYQDKLDKAMSKQSTADDDDKIDIFLVEPEYAPKYTNAKGVCISMRELGLSDYMTDQYRYTKDVVTDDYGNVNGSAWTACPGVYIYRRSAAKQVFGTDDPVEIQKHFSDWDKFAESAMELADEGWKVLAGYDDAYRVYAQNVSGPWVVDGEIRIDKNIMKWVEQTKELADNGCINRDYQWSMEWMDGMTSSGDVFGYFGPAWFIDYSMAFTALDDYGGEAEVGNGTWGDWAAIEGPAPFYWGGYWLCVARGSDNTGLAADIFYQLTCNKEVMEDIITDDWTFCNNRRVMGELAHEGMANGFLGGQNAFEQYCACASDLHIQHGTAYDWDIEQCFRASMELYFDGYANVDVAIDLFYDDVETLYPELVP